jgi:hypothetical protein
MRARGLFEQMAFDAMEDLEREYKRLLSVMHGRPEEIIFRVAFQNVQIQPEYLPRQAMDLSFVVSAGNAGNDGQPQMYLN